MKTKIDSDRLRRIFNECHKIGAREFGGLWLKANENAIHRALYGFDTSELEVKTLMAVIILSTLRTSGQTPKEQA